MPNGYDRLKTLLDSTKDEKEEETTATGSSTKKSGKDRLDALLKKTEGNDTPANTRSKAAYNELVTTGQTTYGGKTYTLPEGQMSIYQKYLADSTAGAAQAVAQWGADQMAARKAAEPEPTANTPRISAADPTPWKTVADYYQPVLEEKKAEANKPVPAGFANAKSYLDSASTQNINPALAGTLAAGLRAGGQEYKPGDTRPGETSKELYTNADLMTQTAWAMGQQRDQMAQQLVQNPSLMYDADFTQGLNSLNNQTNATEKAAGRLMSEYERVTNLRNEQEEKEKYGNLYKNEDYIKYNRGDAELAKKGESATDLKLNRYTNIYRRQGEQEWRDKGGDPTLSDAESFLTDREAGNYFYIAGKQGLNAANEYYKNYLKADAEARKNQAVMEYTQNKVAKGNYATKLAYSGASIVMNKTSVAGMLDLTFQNLRQRFGDASKPINYNTKWQLASNQADAIVKQVSNDIAKDVAKAAEGTKWEKYTDLLAEGATFLYQTGLSTIDSGSSALLVGMGLPEQITLGLMAGNAGMSAIRDAKERGASDGQALASGYAAAFAEYMFEKVSLDQLLEAKNIQNFGQFVKEFNKQGFVEGSEEFATEWATTLTDLLINGDKSSISTDVQSYMANGVSEKEARRAAAWNWTKNIAMSFLGGYLSGGLMQGGNAAVNIATGGNSRLNLAAQVQVQMAVNQAINDNGRVDPDAVRMIENNPEALNMLRGTQAMKNGYRGGDVGKQQIQSAIREIAKQERTARTVLDHAQQARLMGEYTRMMVEAEQQETMQAEMPEATTRAAEERIGPPPAETRADVGTEIPASAEVEAPSLEGPPVPQDRAVNTELQQGTEQNSQLPVQDQQETAQERTAPPVPQQEQRQEAPTPPVPQSVQTAQERTPAQQQSLAKQRQQQTNTPAENLQERGFTTAGADTTVHVRDEQSWDAEEKAVAEQLRARGIEPVFVTGLLEDAQGNKVTFLAEGNRMAIQADHLRQTVQSIAEAALGAKLDVDAGVYQSTAEAAITARTTPKARPVTRSARAQRSLDSAKQYGVTQKDAETAARLADVLGRNILWYNDPARGGTWEDGKTINGAIYINAAVHKEPVVWVVAHELTHNTENAKVYKGLKNLAKQAYKADGRDWQAEVDRRVAAAKHIAETRGNDNYLLKPEMAEQEMTADYFATKVLTDEDTIRQIVRNDPTTARGILSYLKNLLQKLKRKEPTIERAIDLYSKALKEVAAGAQEKGAARGGLTVGTSARSAQDIKNRKYSVQSIFNAAGFQVTMKGGRVIATDGNGQRITEMTEDMVRRSGIGTMIRYAQEVTKSISKAEAQTQVEGLTRLFNLMLKAQDGDMVWRFAGSAMFSAVKSNSDGQYSTTVDFSTVCKKTEEMMRTMSTVMMRTHKGLTKDQIIELQNDILAENGLVPCPVCYVFSRWAGVGGILDNMAKFQKKYDGAEWDDPARMKARIDQLKAATKTKKALQALLMEEDNAYQQFTGELEANQAEQKTLRAEKKNLTGKKADAAANAARVAEIDKRLKELDGLNALLKADIQAIEKSGAPEAAWLERVRSKPNYREEGYVEEDLLYNLLAADRLAEEKPLAWGYRTSRGPSAGKAILPYSDMRVGDWVLGPKANSAKGANPLFSSVGEQFSKDQTKAIDAAKMKVLAQNLIGGQRYQSTSDFMYDYGLDYLLSFFEGQMLGSKMQTYTKVMEFVNLVASVHGDVNISMMPLDAGYITEEDGRQHLIYSSVTGANPEAAIKANHLFDNAQLILVGINDQHILLALEDSEETGGAEIGFVIPYHASGASINNFIRGLVENLKETFDEKNYKNYEPMQNDSHRKNATATQEARERLRRYLLTGKRGKSELMVMTGNPDGLTDTEMKLLKGRSKDISDRSFEELREIEKRALAGDKAAIKEYESWSAGFLGDLYKKMWTNEKAKDTYGVRLTGDQPDHIMPHEFWDTRVDREHAYINGFRFRSYCYSLGLTPRFTGVNSAGKHLGYGDFSDSKGYWKTLIDRPMYDRSGKYRDQQTMNVTELSGSISEENAGMLSPEYGREFWGENAQTPDTGVAARAAERYLERNEEKPRFSARTEEDSTGIETPYNRTAILTEETVDRWLKDYASASNPKYAQAYITRMSPEQFLKLTTSKTGRLVVGSQTGPLDAEKLIEATRQQPLQLRISDGEVVGHEGRHRATALGRANVRSIPILIFDSSNKNSKTDVPEMVLQGQDFGSSRSYDRVTLENMIPLSYANRDRIVQEYGTQDAFERSAEKLGYRQTMRFSARSEAYEDEQNIRSLDARISELQKNLDMADMNDVPAAQQRAWRNELVKLENEKDQAVAKERSLARKTSINDLLENLDKYRRSDLESLAEQVSDSAWDDYEELSDEDLRDALRETLEERAEDLTELQRQAPKFGYSVRPVEDDIESGTVRYSAWTEDEENSIKEQIRRNMDKLKDMETAASVSSAQWIGKSDSQIKEALIKEWRKNGFHVDKQGFGRVDVLEKELRRSVDYMNTKAELAAYGALFRVLKRGRRIDGFENFKTRKYDTVTFAAPVEIDGAPGIMAVVVKQTKGNRYKVHRVLTPEGEKFVLPEKANAESTNTGDIAQRAYLRGEDTPAINSASEKMIAEIKPEVNTKDKPQFSARAERPEGELGSRELLDTPALRKLGIKVTGSVGEYAKTESLIAKDRAAKSLQREARKAEKRLRATDAEKEFANGITAGIYREEDIPRRLNKQTVMELADYYWALNSANLETLHQVRTDINQELRDEAQALLEDVDIKPQSMLKLNERTPERSFRAMFGDRAEEITRWMLDPVRENEAEKIRWYNKQMDAVKTFTDSKGKNRQLTRAESALVMRVMEGRAAADMVAGMEMKAAIQNAATNIRNGEDPGDASKEFGLSGQERDLAEKYAGWIQTQEDLKTADSTIVEAAAKKYAEIFDDYYAAINDFLVAHGYEPIGYIKGYAPHMQPEENQTLLEKAFKSLGINEEVKVLPASIAGQTAMFKPNKRWDPYFLRRNGGATGYDIVKAYQSYVDYMADILFHMDDIMRIRQTANWIRQTYSPEENRAELDRAQQMLYASTEEKQSLLRDAKKIGQNTILSAVDTAKAMQDYVDDLYEKIGDTTEYSNLVMWLTNYADILAGKQSAADRGREYEHGRKLLNFGNRINNIFQKANVAGNLSSMLNQTAQLPMIAAELGEVDFTSAWIDIVSGKTKNWAQDSDFLTAKAGKDMLYSDNADKFINVLFAPASLMDTFVSTIAVRGAFNKAIRKGASYAEAMQTADAFGQSVMGSRAKGSRPLAYESKKFWSKMIHMFQVEAMNSWDHLVTDLPYEIRTIARKQGKAKAAGALAALIIRALLGAFTLNRLSEELYGGTPAPFDILGLAANFVASGKGLSTNQYIRTVIDNAMEKMGYDRIFDTEALSSEDFDLEAAADDLIYNVMNDVPFARNIAGVFGLGDQTMPLPGAGGEFKALGTAVKGMLKDGVEPGEVESLLRATFLAATQFVPGGRQISKTAQGAEAVLRGGSYKGTISGTQKLQYPLEGATDTVKALLFGKNATNAAQEYWASGGNQLTEKMTTLYKSLAENGVGRKEAYDAIQKYRKIDNDDDLTSYERGKAERDLLAGLSITDSQKLEMYRTLSGADSRVEKFQTIMAEGLSFNKMMKVYDKYAELDNIDGMETKEKAAQFSLWVDKQNYSKNQKDAIKDQLKYYSHIPVTADRYEKLTERGLDPADAKKIDEAIDKLPVLPGNKEVTSTQKWRAALGVVKGEADQERALEALMSEEQFRKYKATNVSPSVYVAYKEATNGLESDKDASGKTISGSLKKKVVDYIDGLALTSDQKTALLLDYNSSYSTKDVTWHSSGGGSGSGSYAMARLVTRRLPEAPRAAKPRGGLVATGRPYTAGTGGLVLKKK